MSIPLRELTYGPCPYLAQAPSWKVAEFSVRELPTAVYENLLARGFRRSGTSFYRTICEGCDRCIPIRIDVERFTPTKSQRRVARLNSRTGFAFDGAGGGFREDRFRLYEAYCRDRHGKTHAAEDSALSYFAFLVDSPLGSVAVTEYSTPDGENRTLAGNGYLDVLPDGLSSVYFAWDARVHRLSLGIYSVLREIELCRNLGKRWYYLGFWVPGSRVMDYKANFEPAEIARDGAWIPLGRDLRDSLRRAA